MTGIETITSLQCYYDYLNDSDKIIHMGVLGLKCYTDQKLPLTVISTAWNTKVLNKCCKPVTKGHN